MKRPCSTASVYVQPTNHRSCNRFPSVDRRHKFMASVISTTCFPSFAAFVSFIRSTISLRSCQHKSRSWRKRCLLKHSGSTRWCDSPNEIHPMIEEPLLVFAVSFSWCIVPICRTLVSLISSVHAPLTLVLSMAQDCERHCGREAIDGAGCRPSHGGAPPPLRQGQLERSM